MSKKITFDKGSKRRLKQIRWKLVEVLSLAVLAVFLSGVIMLVVLWELKHEHPDSEPIKVPPIRRSGADETLAIRACKLSFLEKSGALILNTRPKYVAFNLGLADYSPEQMQGNVRAGEVIGCRRDFLQNVQIAGRTYGQKTVPVIITGTAMSLINAVILGLLFHLASGCRWYRCAVPELDCSRHQRKGRVI